MGPSYPRPYGTGAGSDVRVPLIKRAVVDFAVGADWTPATGDVKVSKDGGAAANIATLPTALVMGNTALWVFVFSDAELQCKELQITIADSATKVVEDQSFSVVTYGHASAMFKSDLTLANLTTNVIQLNGSAVAASNLSTSTVGVYVGTITGASPTTTTLVDTVLGSKADNFYKDRSIVFTTGTQKYQLKDITAYVGSSNTLTFSLLTGAPAQGDQYVIL